MTEVTELLAAWQRGEREAGEVLVERVYSELRRLAAGYLRRERIGHTLQPSALVHEAFLRLVDQRVSWQNRAHFFGVAARAMRRILIDHARRHLQARREDLPERSPLHRWQALELDRLPEVLAVDEALRELAARHPEHARVVEMRFFGGMTQREIAAALEVSVPTVGRRWRVARAWLLRYLDEADLDHSSPEGRVAR